MLNHHTKAHDYESAFAALTPLLRRVRRDVTAVRRADGVVAWTDQPLSREALAAHLGGGAARGVSPIDAGSDRCSVAVLDLDSHKGEVGWVAMLMVVTSIAAACSLLGLHCAVFRSRGGQGVHMIFLWEMPQQAAAVRQCMRDLLALVGMREGTGGVGVGEIEIFPKQDSVPVGGHGNMFILPLAGASEWLDPVWGYEGSDVRGLVWQWCVAQPDIEVVERVSAATIGPIERVRSALNALRNDDLPYDDYRNVVFATHAATGGSDAGLAAAIKWSAKSTKHNEHKVRADWHHAKTGRPGGITAATLFAKARAEGWQPDYADAFEVSPDLPRDVVPIGPVVGEDTLALALAAQCHFMLRWTPGMGWMVLKGAVWERDAGLWRFVVTRELCRMTAARAEKASDKKQLLSSKTVAGVLTLAQSDQRFVLPAAAWDADPFVLNTAGGPFDLRTGKSIDPGTHYLTQCTAVAPDFEAAAPAFDRFIRAVFPDDLLGFVQRMLGYLLTGDRREQVLLFWYGAGANGKSTLADLVQWLMGSYGLKLPASALMIAKGERHPTEIAQLRGKRAAFSSELDEGQSLNEALVKELTGDATMTARYMRGDFFTFDQTQKHILIGNFKPRLRGGDAAMSRRLVLLPFDAVFDASTRDPTMPERLRAEGPAILAWMIRGAMQWYAEGLCIPDRVRSAGADYMAAHDDMAQWVEERCDRAGEARASDLYEDFRFWKIDRGEPAPTQTAWGERLSRLPGIEKRRSNGWRYSPIQLRPTA